ncbi:MAG TPA: TlpA disulfide reductase family protein [Arachidicoccus sp.]|nr:TlpA disulfide reductase family protein [Arachidicoccus sp.]
MQKLLLAIIGLLFICPATIQAQNKATLELSMEQPRVHRKIGFQYSGELIQRPDFESILYYSVEDRVYAESLGHALVGTKMLGSFSLPDSAQAFALVFKEKDLIDHNDDAGYIFNVYKDNLPILGTYGSAAVFYGNMSSLLGIKRNYDKAVSLYEKEFAQHPDQKEFYGQDYLMAGLYSKDNSNFLNNLKEDWQGKINRKAPDDSIMQLYTTLSNFDRSNRSAYEDSYLELYPHGLLSAKNAAAKLYNYSTADSMYTAYQALVAAYPQFEPSQILNQQQFYYIVAKKFLEQKNIARFQDFADKVTVNSMRSSLYNSAAWPIAESGNKDSLELGANLAKKAMEAALDMKKDRPSYYTKANWDNVCQNNYGMVADTYAYLLFQQGKVKDALDIQQKAVPGLGSDPDMNMRLVKYLLANQDDGAALEKAAAFTKAGKGNDEIKTLLNEAYKKVNNTDSGFAAYYDKLESTAHQARLDEMRNTMFKTPGHQFTLKNLEGKEITLDGLKGKVVVIDFWATWCGPCKMSFPGMQSALDKYKEDPDVAFLFIDTWENQPTMKERLEQVHQVMENGKYSFHVLLDTPKDTEKSAYNTVSAYGVTGIPTKFVLDKEGNIRFTAVGFDGDSQGLAKELSMMIELAKTAN